MIKVDLSDPGAPPHVPASMFDAVDWPDDAYGEAFLSPASPRGHWGSLVAALDATGPDVLNKRQDRIRRMRHEDGATYNPFDDPTGRGTPWALETIPLPLTAGEWSGLEAGLIQRARLLEQILTDTYGPQNLLNGGWIPSALVFANPNFLRPCHGIQPAGNRFLTYYAADLYRGMDGRFRVLRDYGANPAGLGYALENRIVISRVFPELYHQTQIRRLAPFFHTFHHSLIQRASLRQEDPGIVLLSPGPDSRIYFEHALLSRYLGYPLVEGQDLTVRNGKVFLKKLAGLEPVEAIVRLTADDSSDPFALRRETATGVAGLIQVSREQNIDIVNPIGSGFVDTPALSVFLPSLCQRLMGEDLLLENHPAWWCGNADGLNHVMANLERLTVGPAMDRSAAPALTGRTDGGDSGLAPRLHGTRTGLPGGGPRLGSKPHRFTLYAVAGLCLRHRGGVHRHARRPGHHRCGCGDADRRASGAAAEQRHLGAVRPAGGTLQPHGRTPGGGRVPANQRSAQPGGRPSAVAGALPGTGRGAGAAPAIRFPPAFRRSPPGRHPRTALSAEPAQGRQYTSQAIPEDGVDIPRYRELSDHLNAALYDKERPDSVVAILKRVQEAARNVRDRLSLDSWRVINRLESFADNPASDPLELLDDTLFTLNAFSGLAMESMTRGLGWRFMDMGRRVERAMDLAGLIRIGLPQVCSESRSALEALLEVADSIMTYRARYRTAFQLAPVLDLLIMDEGQPQIPGLPVQPVGGPRGAPAPTERPTLRQPGRAIVSGNAHRRSAAGSHRPALQQRRCANRIVGCISGISWMPASRISPSRSAPTT